MPATQCVLCFSVDPQTQLFARGQPVIVVLSIYNWSEQPLFVGRLIGDEFVNFTVTGPNGKEVLWRGKRRIASRKYSGPDFAVLEKYHEMSAMRTISLKDGTGFVFDKPGQYTVTAEYSLGSSEYVAPFAGKTRIPTGTFDSKASFCIEACIHEPLPVHNNSSQAALDAVRAFYAQITKYQPLGVPEGPAKKALWPLLSKRLARELDDLQACDDDYYRRYGDILQANHYKPATPWLEEGLFTGPNDAATPRIFRILSSRAIGDNRVDVLIAFKEDWGDSEGDVSAILEHRRWVIDDYVAMYENDELRRLSDGYSECKRAQWVGEPPY